MDVYFVVVFFGLPRRHGEWAVVNGRPSLNGAMIGKKQGKHQRNRRDRHKRPIQFERQSSYLGNSRNSTYSLNIRLEKSRANVVKRIKLSRFFRRPLTMEMKTGNTAKTNTKRYQA